MRVRTAVAACALGVAPLMLAEYTFFTPRGSFTVEVSLENSPYPRLPIYRNAVTSLEVVGDYAIGGTSAKEALSPYLFAVSLSNRKLEYIYDIAKVMAGQRAVVSGFGRAADGSLYGGTMPAKAGSGHLFRVRLGAAGLEVKDLGVPVPGEGVFAAAASPRGETVYGIAHPSGKFFAFDVREGSTKVFAEASPTRRDLGFLHQYALEPADFLCRRLAVDRQGRVYGSKPVNKLFRFDPEKGACSVLEDELPEGWGRRPLGRVDAWAVSPDGILYGGNAADGQLFRLDPATGKVTNLGKPAMMPRITGLAFAADGKLYGIAGARPGYAHLFQYEAGGRGFTDLGNPRFTMTAPGIEQGIAWRGFQIGTLAVSEDGRYVVMGEDEALSQLMVFPVRP